MKNRILRAAALVAVLVLSLAALTACNNDNPVVIYDSNATTTEPETQPTVAIPEGRLSLSKLMGLMGPSMVWSDIRDYDHDDVSDSEATFIVQNNSGQTCTLSVTYDPATDAIFKATLSCGDVEADVMTGETAIIRQILVAMNQQG